MRYLMLLSVGLLVGCAASVPTSDDSVKFQVSDRAFQVIEEQGKATAAMLGHARDTDLVCERFYKVGSHITTSVCYTREEGELRRLNHQEEYRSTQFRTPICVEGGARPGLSPGRVTLSNRGASC